MEMKKEMLNRLQRFLAMNSSNEKEDKKVDGILYILDIQDQTLIKVRLGEEEVRKFETYDSPEEYVSELLKERGRQFEYCQWIWADYEKEEVWEIL